MKKTIKLIFRQRLLTGWTSRAGVFLTLMNYVQGLPQPFSASVVGGSKVSLTFFSY
jgi:hypothetical protein